MTSNERSRELDDFLLKYPETRFMDIFVPDLNGVLRGKRIQAGEFSKVFGNGSNYVASTPLMNILGDVNQSISYGNDDGDPENDPASCGDVIQIALWLAMECGRTELLDDVERRRTESRYPEPYRQRRNR